MNEDVKRKGLRRDNLFKELKSRVSSSKFEEVLIEKIDWLLSLGVKIVPVGARTAIEMEGINYGGKVSWEKESVPKKPISLMINMLDFADMRFIAILLHECGHVKDKDNDSVLLETTESEISAWNNAINDLKNISLEDSEKEIFTEVMKKALASYKVEEEIITKMIAKI